MSNSQSAISNSQSSGSNRKVVLAVASAGGHWVQLRRLHPAFAGAKLIYATTRESYRAEVEADGATFHVVPDCNRWEKWKLFKSACAITWLILTKQPDVIVTTGAAPGFFAIRIGKLFGKRVVWVDSIANAEELSLSGQKAGQHAHLWLTQWKHLAQPDGPHFSGNVLGDDTPSQDQGSATSNPASEQPPPPLPTVGASLLAIQQPQLSQSAIRDSQSAEGSNHRSPIRSEPDKKLRIFVTVGTDLPFDRLVKALDDWAPAHPEFEVFAQIGQTSWTPKNIPYCHFIEPPEFKLRFQKADLVVSHAGMGTILSSLSFQKPLLVMPRIAALGEHRNEHQLATAKHLAELNKVNVAPDETALLAMLDNIDALPVKAQIGPHASRSLTDKIKSFIAND